MYNSPKYRELTTTALRRNAFQEHQDLHIKRHEIKTGREK